MDSVTHTHSTVLKIFNYTSFADSNITEFHQHTSWSTAGRIASACYKRVTNPTIKYLN